MVWAVTYDDAPWCSIISWWEKDGGSHQKMDAPFCQSVAWEHRTFSFISNVISYPPSYNHIPILAWFRDSYFTFDGSSTIHVFPLLFNHANGKITLANWWNGNCNFSSSCTQWLPYNTNPCFHSCEGPHCKDKMPKICNKYSQERNIGVSVLISKLCVCERIIYFHDGSAFSAGRNMWTDPGNI